MSIIFNFRLPLPTPRFLPPEQSGSGENTQSIILLSNVVKTHLRDLGELLTTLLGVTDGGSANRQIWSNSCGPIIQHWCWDEWKSQSQGPIKFWIECPFLSYFKRQGFCPRLPQPHFLELGAELESAWDQPYWFHRFLVPKKLDNWVDFGSR